MFKYLAVAMLLSAPAFAGCEIGGCGHEPAGFHRVAETNPYRSPAYGSCTPECARGCSKNAFVALCGGNPTARVLAR